MDGMEKYVGAHKDAAGEVLAKPMTRGEYAKYRLWDVPYKMDANDEGYIVQYPASDVTSWSAKQQFEAAYNRAEAK